MRKRELQDLQEQDSAQVSVGSSVATLQNVEVERKN